MRRQAKKFAKGSPSEGSAIILTVVLTSLLAMVGVLFVMMARVNQIATSGISESRELDSAIETVIAEISEELALDIPRKDSNGVELSEYYDYPGSADKWLASLEPYEKTAGNYYWRQISDVTGYLEYKGFGRQDVDVELPLAQRPKPSESWVRDYPQINVDEDGDFLDKDGALATEGLWADADGDGVADSKWVELDDITSSKGKPIYAAIRIIDNGGMLNVNTAYKFDPNETNKNLIDGSSQTQINLAALCRGTTKPFSNLDDMRKGGEIWDLDSYIDEVVWRIEEPEGLWTPFDISDELKLRNRYIISKTSINTRIGALWTKAFDWEPYVPRNEKDHSIDDPNDWFWYVNNSSPDTNSYNYRHIATTYNMDRIIRPDGGRMLNINHDDPNVNVIYNAIRAGLIDGGITDPNSPAAQITVNLIDFRDKDVNDNVTTITVDGTTYYGFERPCVYISELAHRFVAPDISPLPDNLINMSYGIELYKPYSGDDDPNDWQLVIEDYGTFPVDWSGTKSFHVMLFEHQDAPLDVNSNASLDREQLIQSGVRVFKGGKTISLQRLTDAGWISVDSKPVPYPWEVGGGWLEPDGIAHSVQRDIQLHKCIRRLWATVARDDDDELGTSNTFVDSDPNVIQAHPANGDFTNIGEIGMIFRKAAYYEIGQDPYLLGVIGYSTPADTEATVRINLADPNYQQIFKYLTVMDPSEHVLDPNETRVKGRININTAPWYVISQLPWVSQRRGGYSEDKLARAIVAYRDMLNEPTLCPVNYTNRYIATSINGISEEPGFTSIGELATVINDTGQNAYSMRYYTLGTERNDDLDGFPDLTPGGSSPDGAADDFEERDLIFARISNLVTVRSDVFTAYILVRIGTDGPQKRVIAILDRSDVYSPTNRVKIVAVHPVADPR